MAKGRELTGNRDVTKGNPARDRIMRAKRREVDATVQELIDGPKTIKPFRGRDMLGLNL